MTETPKDGPALILKRCPRLVACLIAASLGYAVPMAVAMIVIDTYRCRPSFYEWIAPCFPGDPFPVGRRGIKSRGQHAGLMLSYRQALAIGEEICRRTERLLSPPGSEPGRCVDVSSEARLPAPWKHELVLRDMAQLQRLRLHDPCGRRPWGADWDRFDHAGQQGFPFEILCDAGPCGASHLLEEGVA